MAKHVDGVSSEGQRPLKEILDPPRHKLTVVSFTIRPKQFTTNQ